MTLSMIYAYIYGGKEALVTVTMLHINSLMLPFISSMIVTFLLNMKVAH